MGKLQGMTTPARMMRARGWTVRAIARLYGATEAHVLALLRSRLPPSPRKPKPVDPWKGTWCHRDDEVEVAAVPQICAGQLVQAPTPAIAVEPIKSSPSPWSGPSSPCQTSLHGGRRRIKD